MRCRLSVALLLSLVMSADARSDAGGNPSSAPGFTISGTLTSETGEPVAGGVCIYTTDGRFVACSHADSLGRYVSPSLTAGPYRVRTSGTDGFVAEAFNDLKLLGFVDPFPLSDVVELGPWNAADIDFELTAGFAVAGSVTAMSGGSPIAAEVCVFQLSGIGVLCTSSDHQGDYRTEALPPEQYIVAISKARGHGLGVLSDVSQWSHSEGFVRAVLVDVQAGDAVGVDFVLDDSVYIPGAL